MTKQTIKVIDRTDRVETGSVEFVYSDGREKTKILSLLKMRNFILN
jgi:hypothetical protein